MDFKEILKQDARNVFLNAMEFADSHTVNGKTVTAVLQDRGLSDTVRHKFDDEVQTRSRGLYGGGKVLYIAADDTAVPKPQAAIEVDGRRYIVEAAVKYGEIYEITLSRYGGR